jgi:hypothetical protein
MAHQRARNNKFPRGALSALQFRSGTFATKELLSHSPVWLAPVTP